MAWLQQQPARERPDTLKQTVLAKAPSNLFDKRCHSRVWQNGIELSSDRTFYVGLKLGA